MDVRRELTRSVRLTENSDGKLRLYGREEACNNESGTVSSTTGTQMLKRRDTSRMRVNKVTRECMGDNSIASAVKIAQRKEEIG